MISVTTRSTNKFGTYSDVRNAEVQARDFEYKSFGNLKLKDFFYNIFL